MVTLFGEALQRARQNKELTQQELADMVSTSRSAIANWEAGRRLPDMVMIERLSKCLDVDVMALWKASEPSASRPVVMAVDDERIALSGAVSVLKRVFPSAEIVSFTKPSEALSFAEENEISVAFLDIEMGQTSGLDLSKKLLSVNPRLNVFFLTAYPDYALPAWETGACGFLVKPMTVDSAVKALSHLRYPIGGLE